MKTQNKIIIGVLALVLLGWGASAYLNSKQKAKITDNSTLEHTNKKVKVDVTDADVETDNDIDLSGNSFDELHNESKGTTTTTTKESVPTKTVTHHKSTKATIDTLSSDTEVTLFGIYYFDVINKHGFDKCTLSDNDNDDKSSIEYDEDNYRLKNVLIEGDSAYLFVDAEETPEKICAHLLLFKKAANAQFDAIYVIVE